jgi:hypothetical protein
MSRFLLIASFAFFALSCETKGPVIERNLADSIDSSKRAIAQKKRATKPGVIYLKELKKGQRNAYEDAIGRLGDTMFYCTYKGRIEYMDTAQKKRNFLFDIRAEFMVDRIYIARWKDDRYFLVWQETDHNGVTSYAAVFRAGEEKPIWKEMFRLPNPGPPAIDGSDAYISMLGMVAKMSLEDGAFAWKLDSMYNTSRQTFQKFEPVQVYEERIVFIDYPIPGRRPNRDTLVLDPKSGEKIK